MSKRKGRRGLVDQLKQAIGNSGRSLNQLGRDAGIDPGRLSRFLRGERDLTLAAAEKICLALGLTLTESAPPAKRKREK